MNTLLRSCANAAVLDNEHKTPLHWAAQVFPPVFLSQKMIFIRHLVNTIHLFELCLTMLCLNMIPNWLVSRVYV